MENSTIEKKKIDFESLTEEQKNISYLYDSIGYGYNIDNNSFYYRFIIRDAVKIDKSLWDIIVNNIFGASLRLLKDRNKEDFVNSWGKYNVKKNLRSFIRFLHSAYMVEQHFYSYDTSVHELFPMSEWFFLELHSEI